MSPPARCTCTGCPPHPSKVLWHYWQYEQWAAAGVIGWCDPPCADEHSCARPASAEDLLCDKCRQLGGISRMDERRIRVFLAANPDRYADAVTLA